MAELILGVDGGGSKTIACVARLEQGRLRELGRGFAGGANLVAVGEQAALRELALAVQQACQHADCEAGQIQRACLALAGSDRQVVRQRVASWARDSGLRGSLQLVHDAEAVLVAGSAAGRGIALVCGTGSLAFGRSRADIKARAGGWGPLLGDEGSGYRLALAALRAVVRQVDGRGRATELTSSLMERCGVEQPLDLPQHVAACDRAQLAALAPLVFQAAGRHDRVARALLEQAADSLARLVASLARRLDWTEGAFPLVLSGGLLLNFPQYVALLHQCLMRRRMVPASVQLVSDPVQGALLLASR